MTKVCTKCQETKVLEEFGKLKAAADGRHSWCKACLYSARKEYGAKNTEKFREYNQAYHQAHREKNLQSMVEYRQQNLEHLRQKDAEKYERVKAKRKELGLGRKPRGVLEDGRVECTKCKEFKAREEFSTSTENNLGLFPHCKRCVSAHVKEWREKNYDRDKAKHAEYRERNRERIRAVQKARYAAPGTPKYFEHIRGTYGLTKDQYVAMLEAQQHCCVTCHCQFREREARGKETPHVDHDHVTGKVRGLLCGHCNIALGGAKDNPDILRNLASYIEQSAEKAAA